MAVTVEGFASNSELHVYVQATNESNYSSPRNIVHWGHSTVSLETRSPTTTIVDVRLCMPTRLIP
jgi:hypothetical protein